MGERGGRERVVRGREGEGWEGRREGEEGRELSGNARLQYHTHAHSEITLQSECWNLSGANTLDQGSGANT